MCFVIGIMLSNSYDQHQLTNRYIFTEIVRTKIKQGLQLSLRRTCLLINMTYTCNLVWTVLPNAILTRFNARSSRRWQRQLGVLWTIVLRNLSVNYFHGDRALKAQFTLTKWRSLSIKQNRISKQVVDISHPTLKLSPDHGR